ncbi:MAG TPA: YciI family protein [Conexibacter sp.]|nr:YciI family protein [Conexibacter sp.]
MPENRPTLEALLDGVAGLTLYRVQMHPTERFAAENSREVLHRHLLWLLDLQRRGTLFLCGPVGWGDGWDGSGMGVLRAGSLEAARALAEQEPYHAAGLRRNEVESWTVNEGSLTVRVDLLEGSGSLS